MADRRGILSAGDAGGDVAVIRWRMRPRELGKSWLGRSCINDGARTLQSIISHFNIF